MIHLFGDSISSGNIGMSLPWAIEQSFGINMSVHAVDGDTMRGVTARALRYVKKHPADTLILECGSNDLLLPHFLQSGDAGRKQFAGQLIHSSSRPAEDIDEFVEEYTSTLRELAFIVNDIALTSIPILGEQLDTPIQQKRREYNHRLKLMARQLGLQFINLAKPLEELVRTGGSQSDYFFESTDNFTRDARFIAGDPSKADKLSSERGLHATIDGVHLNARGAEAAASAFKEFILQKT
jgi:lysophospholipase L1-like esterase